jgi:hypothetical protein
MLLPNLHCSQTLTDLCSCSLSQQGGPALPDHPAALYEREFLQHTVLHPFLLNQPLNWRRGACLRACQPVYLRAYAKEWLAAKAPEIGARADYSYSGGQAQFFNYFRSRTDAPMTDLTKIELTAYRNDLPARSRRRLLTITSL